MRSFQNHTGINIAKDKIQLVEVNFTGDEFLIENVDEEFFDEFIDFETKETKIIASLQNAFNEIITRKPLNSKNISFTLPHDFFYIAQLPFEPTLVQTDLIEHFKWEISVLYPQVSSEDLALQFIHVESPASSQRAILFAIPKRYIKILNDFSFKNNLKLKYIDNLHIAADNLISFDYSIIENDVILSLYVAGEFFSIDIRQANKPLYFKTIHLENAAEFLPKLSEVLINNPAKVNIKTIKKAFISGSNVSDTLLNKAKEKLNLELVKLDPFGKIKINPALLGKKYISENPYTFASAAGIAYRIV